MTASIRSAKRGGTEAKGSRRRTTQEGEIRIIGGHWRSRRIRFPATTLLRPSPDAVRETLFNWLRDDIEGAHCFDLFAGSGALGFEAVSRGAASSVMVEADPQLARRLRDNTAMLDAADRVEVIHSRVSQFLKSSEKKADIIFMDPPFEGEHLISSCELISTALAESRLLNPGGLIYIESPRSNLPLPIPSAWHIIRDKSRGNVRATLIQPETHE